MLYRALVVTMVVSIGTVGCVAQEDEDEALEESRCNTNCGEMLGIEEGKFWMGCNEEKDDNCDDDEYPYREVYLDAFEIDKYEVTVEQYRACVEDLVCTRPGIFYNPTVPKACNWGYSDGDEHPINCVDWEQAYSYCLWARKRLPTEAEWEKAARGTEGIVYPWGDEEPSCDLASKQGCEWSRTEKAGSKIEGASPYGVLDMSGNVAEWVSDWYEPDYYQTAPDDKPPGPKSGRYRIIRGGAWTFSGNHLRTSERSNTPSRQSVSVGFRCARTPGAQIVTERDGEGGRCNSDGTCDNDSVCDQNICRKAINYDKGFGFYLMNKQISPDRLSFVDIKTIKLEEEPIISSEDIVSYSKELHEIELTKFAAERLIQLDLSRYPFVAAVDGEKVYMGYFDTIASSSIYEGIVVLCPLVEGRTTISIYNDTNEADDLRNDPRILGSLEEDGKLI